MVFELSILIPIYNYEVTALVQKLLDQCQQATITFEIICLDDASDSCFKKANQKLKFLKKVIYEELPGNINRAAIRNKLASSARFSYLLFLDNDSEIISDRFISDYLQAANPFTVFIGGTVYQPPPPKIKYRLHWRYGSQREQRPAHVRQQQPYNQLQVNNLFVSRALYLANPMPEIIQTYGHEDTLWGQQLEKAKIMVQHVDNPVLHAGLEPVTTFLLKTEQAVNNLANLTRTDDNNLNTSLIRAYRFLEKLRAKHLFYLFFKTTRFLLLLQLQSARPSLLLFDIYKLGLFVNANRKIE
jgi:glycosyltransferase involved in cell wall biosynthesis